MTEHRTPATLTRTLGIAALAALAVGCPDAGSRPVTVRGTVTLDGTPVERGEIVFDPATPGANGSDAGTVADGRFELQVSPGPKLVRIRATRPAKFKAAIGPSGGPLAENYVPARYNRNTELSADVAPGAANELRFELRTK
ncbi:hypothetical protein [Gemmata sp.]|uniref:hypothetical protein n=1 Tax=Gemmata sp. TaxID=1914242 RepID=UPI003F71CDD2